MKFYFVIILVLSFHCFASEVDNFTRRDEPLRDATDVLNQAANHFLDQAVVSANKSGACDKQRLYRAIKLRFRDRYQDKFADYVHTSPDVTRRTTKIKDSIYADASPINSLIMGGLGAVYDSNAPVLNIHNVQIGGDKFEHFFGMGYYYFRRHYLQGQAIEKVLDFGMGTETGILGRYMTGIISFADLAANFKGMHFWNHLLHEGPDVLHFAKKLGPYIRCEQDQWVRIEDIDLSQYVDNAWDEAINCVLFSNQKFLEKVQNQLVRLSQQSGQSVTCLVSSDAFGELTQIYSPYGPKVLNKKGHGLLKKN